MSAVLTPNLPVSTLTSSVKHFHRNLWSYVDPMVWVLWPSPRYALGELGSLVVSRKSSLGVGGRLDVNSNPPFHMLCTNYFSLLGASVSLFVKWGFHTEI